MNRYLVIIAAAAVAVAALTWSSVAAEKRWSLPAMTDIDITSTRGAQLKPEENLAIYRGDVRASNNVFYVRCEHLSISFLSPAQGTNRAAGKSGSDAAGSGIGGTNAVESLNMIIAETNAVIEVRGTNGVQIGRGDKAIFYATNEVIELRGAHPVFEGGGLVHQGDGLIRYDLRTGNVESPGMVRTTLAVGPGGLFGNRKRSGNSASAAATNASPPEPGK